MSAAPKVNEAAKKQVRQYFNQLTLIFVGFLASILLFLVSVLIVSASADPKSHDLDLVMFISAPLSSMALILIANRLFVARLRAAKEAEKLYQKIDRNMDRLIKTYRFFSKLGVGRLFNRFLPICDIDGTLPKGLPYDQLRELCVLDTFDMYSPQYDQPQRIKNVVGFFNKYNMEKIWGGFIYYDNCRAAVVKGFKP